MSPDEPQSFVLTNWALLLRQRVEGFREPSNLFGKHSRSAKRLINSVTPENPTLPPELISKMVGWRLDTVIERTKNKPGYEPIEDTIARMKTEKPPAGFLTAFFRTLREEPKSGLPLTVGYADEIDQLSSALIKDQWPGLGRSLERYKRTLLSSPLVERQFWVEPSRNLDFLPLFEKVDQWQDAWNLTQIVNLHLQISLLAQWDVEYCAAMFPRFTPIPLFLNLAPRIRSRQEQGSNDILKRTNPRGADVIDGPYSLLIDLIWCLLRYGLNGGWPQNFSSHRDVCGDLNSFTGDFAQLRIGNPNLTADLYDSLWPGMSDAAGEQLRPPLACLAAAHVWDMIIPGKPPFVPVDKIYMNAWHRCRWTQLASQPKATSPSIDWPAYLNRGLEIPSPTS